MTGRPLRRNDLTPVRFTVADKERRGGPTAEEGRFCCAVTRKEITHQPVVLLKSTGQVMLEDVAKRLAFPTMTCPITGKKFREKDVIYLKSGGTAYSSHNTVQAEKYRPTLR